ncbi:uncharacterized protein LOC144347580 [Saccoglossus kowalevskii]
MSVAPLKEDSQTCIHDRRKKLGDSILGASIDHGAMGTHQYIGSRIVASCPNLANGPLHGDSMLTVTGHRKLQVSVSSDGTIPRSRVGSYSRWQSRHSSMSSDPPKINIIPLNSVSLSTSRDSVKSSIASMYSSNEALDINKVIPTIRIDDNPKPVNLMNNISPLTSPPSTQCNSPWNFMNVKFKGSSTSSMTSQSDIHPPESISETALEGVTYYGDQNVSQILEFLFVGNIEAAYNEPLLCRINIHSIIDMSGVLPRDVPRSKVKDFPCSCPSPWKHTRARLNISIPNSEKEDMVPYFKEINNFLEGARLKNRNVLVHGNHGRSRCIVAVIQYMMQCHHMDLQDAYHLVKKRRPGVKMNVGFQRTLEKLESQLHPGRSPSFLFDMESQMSVTGSTQNSSHQAWV